MIRAGLVIDRNTTLRRGTYRIASAGLDAPVITIRGSNIDLDLGGVDLIGSPESARPDQYNGVEATFSRNRFINNRVEENWHGLWGGYSFDSLIAGNTFARNQEAIAIEHGQNNVIASNTFTDDDIGVRPHLPDRGDEPGPEGRSVSNHRARHRRRIGHSARSQGPSPAGAERSRAAVPGARGSPGA